MTTGEGFVLTLIAVVVLAIIGAGVWIAHENATKDERFKMACIAAGGSYASNACIAPRPEVPR